MAINISQSPTQETSITGTGGASCSFASLPGTGHAVIVVVKTFADGAGPVPVSIADNQSGNTYLNIQSQNGANYAGCTAIWWCPTIASPSGTFTVTPTFGSVPGDAYKALIELYEVSGLAGTVDQSISTNDGGTGVETTTITNSSANTNANDLVMCAIVTGNASFTGTLGTPTTGYTVLNFTDGTTAFGKNGNTAYKIVSSIEASSANWNWSTDSNSYFNAVLVSFKGASAGGANQQQIPLLGASLAPLAWIIQRRQKLKSLGCKLF